MLLGAPTAYWAIVAGIIGLALGSFATVVASRWPAGGSLVSPRSHCTSCARTLTPLELVPGAVVGRAARPLPRLRRGRLVALPRHRARQRRCSRPAPSSGFGPTWEGLSAALLGVALVPVVVIDLEHHLIPDIIVLPAAALCLAAAIAADPREWWVSVAAALGASGFLFLLWLVHPGGMGLGDVKLALLLGAVLGASVIPALLVAFAGGAALGVVLLARFGSRARKMAVPFGPFLAAGALAGLWFGPAMIGWYAERLG